MGKLRGKISGKFLIPDVDSFIYRLKQWFLSHGYSQHSYKIEDKGDKVKRKLSFRKGGVLYTLIFVSIELSGKRNDKLNLKIKYSGKKKASEEVENLSRLWENIQNLITPPSQLMPKVPSAPTVQVIVATQPQALQTFRNCPICGSKIEDPNAVFCPYCGARLK